jgi:hypothetical protein
VAVVVVVVVAVVGYSTIGVSGSGSGSGSGKNGVCGSWLKLINLSCLRNEWNILIFKKKTYLAIFFDSRRISVFYSKFEHIYKIVNLSTF